MRIETERLIIKQFKELAQTFPDLKLCKDAPQHWVIRGLLSFSATYKNVTIADTFSILISLPDGYPNSPPTVQETGGRIPGSFHQFHDRTFCLGAPMEVVRRFKDDPRLLAFVKTLVVEYLYGYAYFEKHGTLPFGELSHGCKGISEYYKEIFGTDDVKIVLGLLKVLADGAYRGHHLCPCGNGKKLRQCHGPVMLDLMKCQQEGQLLRDVENVFYSLEERMIEDMKIEQLPKHMKRKLDRMARERAKLEKCP